MNTLNAMVWLFPILFMIHDFEEIILTRAWKKKYRKAREESNMKRIPFSDFVSADSFSIGVLEEFFIFSIVCLFSCCASNYVVWYGLFFGIVFHFLIHIRMNIQFKHYTPGFYTALLFLPFGAYFLYKGAIMTGYSVRTLCLSAIFGLIVIILNVVVLHKMMPVMEHWLTAYEKE